MSPKVNLHIPNSHILGGRSEWMKGNWLKDMMDAYMNMDQKDELFKLSNDTPPRIKSERKAKISQVFGSKKKRKSYGSLDKILKIFCNIEANGFSCFKSTYLALHSAKFNHSCLPNAERTQFRKADGSFEIVAVTNIKKGEEITISYSWSVSMKSRGSRQKIIQNRFYFDCKCNFCQEEAGYYNNDMKIYNGFDSLVEKLQELKPSYEYNDYGQIFMVNSNTAALKRQLIVLKEMYKLGKTKNLGPSGKYEIMNEGYIVAFKIACDVIDDEEFKTDAKEFATEGKKLQELYNFCEPEPGEWTKRQNVDQCIDNLIDKRNSGGYSRG